MGFMDKVKNLFTEEIEVEETPIKKEVLKVEIPAPTIREEKKEPVIKKEPVMEVPVKREEKEVPKEEVKQTRTPVFFDDKDFINLDTPKKVEKKEPTESYKKTVYSAKREEVKKKFSPSPIISPVYGVLDKNYHKEDIATKPETKRKYRSSYASSKDISIDDVMRKAYGTLEDDLVNSLEKEPEESFEVKAKTEFDDFDILKEPPVVERKTRENRIDPLSGLELDADENDLLNDNFGDQKKSSEDNLLEKEMNKIETSENNKEEALNLKESDLFNLIDSMYEKRDEQ